MGILKRHKWKDVYSISMHIFLGEKCFEKIKTRFRICEKCGKAQEFRVMYDYCKWVDLSDCETNVLLNKVVDKGDYYLLENNKEGGNK